MLTCSGAECATGGQGRTAECSAKVLEGKFSLPVPGAILGMFEEEDSSKKNNYERIYCAVKKWQCIVLQILIIHFLYLW